MSVFYYYHFFYSFSFTLECLLIIIVLYGVHKCLLSELSMATVRKHLELKAITFFGAF